MKFSSMFVSFSKKEEGHQQVVSLVIKRIYFQQQLDCLPQLEKTFEGIWWNIENQTQESTWTKMMSMAIHLKKSKLDSTNSLKSWNLPVGSSGKS